MKNYFIYITTNSNKEVLYIGITNNFKKRLSGHYKNKGKVGTFAGEYYYFNLIYWERFPNAKHAIERETQLKNWNRKKKENLIVTMNPNWTFMNYEIFAESAF